MVKSIGNKDNTDIIRVDDDKAQPGEVPLVIVQYETRRTSELGNVVQQELIGNRLYTTLTLQFHLGIGLNMLLAQHIGNDLPIIDEDYLKHRALGVKVSDDRSTISFTVSRLSRDDDLGTDGKLLSKIRHAIIDGALVVNIYLTRETAWGICTVFAGNEFQNIMVTMLDAIEEARTTTPQ